MNIIKAISALGFLWAINVDAGNLHHVQLNNPPVEIKTAGKFSLIWTNPTGQTIYIVSAECVPYASDNFNGLLASNLSRESDGARLVYFGWLVEYDHTLSTPDTLCKHRDFAPNYFELSPTDSLRMRFLTSVSPGKRTAFWDIWYTLEP